METENKMVGLMITVSVAVMLLVAMIPAMLPAQEGGDDGPAPYVTAIEKTGGGTYSSIIFTLKNGDTVLATITTSDSWGGWVGPFTMESTSHYDSIRATGDSIVAGVYDSGGVSNLNFTARNPAELAASGVFTKLSDDNYLTPAIVDYTVATIENIPDIYTLLWESFFVGTSYDPGFDPEHPGGGDSGGVDTNTTLILATITMLFISIVVMVVRSYGSGKD